MATYDPYSAINAIYKYKTQWSSANEAGDEAKKNEAARNAQEYYRQLRANGYSDTADELAAAGLDTAKRIHDKWAKTGRNPVRSYLYSLGAKDGLTTKQMDSLIGWDNDTGEVSFGGKVIGKPDRVVDGVSYMADTSPLDKAYEDYKDRSGLTRSKTVAVDKENEKLFSNYNDEYKAVREGMGKDPITENPFSTDAAKSILGRYDLEAYTGRDNALASGTASNGGNIDSFSAANAMRQQAALRAKGEAAVLAAHEQKMNAYQQRLDHAKGLLSDMGVNIERVYNEDETSKNNQVSRDVATSEVTGVVPENMSYANNPFFFEDGTLKRPDDDYQNIINNARERLKTVEDPAEKRNLEATLKYALQARAHKILNLPEYSKYANTMELYAPDETYTSRNDAANRASAERISTYQTDRATEAAQAQAAADVAKAQLESDTELQKAAMSANATVAAAQAKASSGKSDKKTSDGELSGKDIKSWAKILGIDVTETAPGKYKATNKNDAILKVYNSDSISEDDRKALLGALDISATDIDNLLTANDKVQFNQGSQNYKNNTNKYNVFK